MNPNAPDEHACIALAALAGVLAPLVLLAAVVAACAT